MPTPRPGPQRLPGATNAAACVGADGQNAPGASQGSFPVELANAIEALRELTACRCVPIGDWHGAHCSGEYAADVETLVGAVGQARFGSSQE